MNIKNKLFIISCVGCMFSSINAMERKGSYDDWVKVGKEVQRTSGRVREDVVSFKDNHQQMTAYDKAVAAGQRLSNSIQKHLADMDAQDTAQQGFLEAHVTAQEMEEERVD